MNPAVVDAALVGITGAGGNESVLYELDPSTGAATMIGSTGLSHVTGLAFHPTTGVLFGHRNDRSTGIGQLYTIDRLTAAPTLIGTTGISSPDITFGADGTLYGWMELGSASVFSSDVDDLVTFDLVTGQVTRVGESQPNTIAGDGFTNQTGLAFDSTGTLFLKSGDADAAKPQAERVGQMYRVDPATGQATPFLTLDQNPVNELEFDGFGNALTLSRGMTSTMLQSIDLQTGQVRNEVEFQVAGLTSIASLTAIPEPSSILLVIIGGIGMVAVRRSKFVQR